MANEITRGLYTAIELVKQVPASHRLWFIMTVLQNIEFETHKNNEQEVCADKIAALVLPQRSVPAGRPVFVTEDEARAMCGGVVPDEITPRLKAILPDPIEGVLVATNHDQEEQSAMAQALGEHFHGRSFIRTMSKSGETVIKVRGVDPDVLASVRSFCLGWQIAYWMSRPTKKEKP